jgi:hypothetical protein
MKGKRTRGAIAFAASTLAATILLSTPQWGWATNFGSAGTPGGDVSDNGVWLTNNYLWYGGKRALSDYDAAVNWVVTNQYNPTNLQADFRTASDCPDASYDVCVFDSFYGNTGWIGVNQCITNTTGSHPNQVCSLAFNKYNLSFTPNTKRSLVCEELGHSVGLRHRFTDPVSCMSQQGDVLVTHDKNHINANYG